MCVRASMCMFESSSGVRLEAARSHSSMGANACSLAAAHACVMAASAARLCLQRQRCCHNLQHTRHSQDARAHARTHAASQGGAHKRPQPTRTLCPQRSRGTASSVGCACSPAPQAPQPARWRCPARRAPRGCTSPAAMQATHAGKLRHRRGAMQARIRRMAKRYTHTRTHAGRR